MQVFLNLVLDRDHLSSYFCILLESNFYLNFFLFLRKKNLHKGLESHTLVLLSHFPVVKRKSIDL